MALLTLAAFSAAAGVLILAVLKATSRQTALRAARRKVRAHLLAIRLFDDDPRLILRSQGRLAVWTARYMALLLPAFLAVGIPLYFAWDGMDGLWGRTPLEPGATTMVTAGVRDSGAEVRLDVPGWLRVESPAVHAEAEHEVSWRVRVIGAGSGEVTVSSGSEHAALRVEARPGWRYLPERAKTSGGPILWVETRYPHHEWWLWFLAISTVSALVLRRRMRVTL